MGKVNRIAGYCRISVDDELDKDNVSIEHQKRFITDYAEKYFPGCSMDFYEDRDRSGYTFEQRENYQLMKKGMLDGKYDILLVKDFSRFSRRMSKGFGELEDLMDLGIRIISIGDSIDSANMQEWLTVQFKFMMNEMPVTETSKKVKAVVKQRQENGEWLCAVPYGYVLNLTDKRKDKILVDQEAAVVVQEVFKLYIDGWGYKKIANYLTDQKIPTPRMLERIRKEEQGVVVKTKAKAEWSIVSIQGILDNDFYIGTLRQGKYTRAKINGTDVKTDEKDHILFERNHEAIIDEQTFYAVQELRKIRTKSNYRGVKKYANTYTGMLYCGDCGSPMFSMSRGDLKPAYICGTYHKQGKKACTSHHTRVDLLDRLLKRYIQRVKDNSGYMLGELNMLLKTHMEETEKLELPIDQLQTKLDLAMAELKSIKKQRIRDIMKAPEREAFINEIYYEMEEEQEKKIENIQKQLELVADKRNMMIQVTRATKTVLDVFDNILEKDSLEKTDISFIVDKIVVTNDRIDIQLKADIDRLLSIRPKGDNIVNFNEGSVDNSLAQIVYKERNQRDKVYTVNVISEGDPLEIFTDREGEIILKKYSPIGELGVFAKEYAESLAQTAGHITCIVDKDQIIAVSGGGKKEFFEKHISPEMENCINKRTTLIAERNDSNFVPVLANDDGADYNHQLIMPIIAEGDAMGAIVFLSKDQKMGEVEGKLAQTAAGFLGKQMEQ